MRNVGSTAEHTHCQPKGANCSKYSCDKAPGYAWACEIKAITFVPNANETAQDGDDQVGEADADVRFKGTVIRVGQTSNAERWSVETPTKGGQQRKYEREIVPHVILFEASTIAHLLRVWLALPICPSRSIYDVCIFYHDHGLLLDGKLTMASISFGSTRSDEASHTVRASLMNSERSGWVIETPASRSFPWVASSWLQ